MKDIKYVFETFVYTIGAVFWGISAYLFISELANVTDLSKFTFTIKNGFVISLKIFIVLLLVSGTIVFTIKTIQCLFLAYYYGLFYNPKYDNMHIKIDQDGIIRESFIELKNGEKIPVFISRIVTHKPESNTGENNE